MSMALELLAPAKNAEQGILALRCGADALYMGANRFGARQGASNGIEAFAQVCEEARLWGAQVFATMNTVLYDHELDAARSLAWDLYNVGVDALIVQDMALLEMDLPPIQLHASTQAVCDSPEKVAFLASTGFTRVVLAREMSLEDIRAIRAASDVELEAFVYGALCVGESGKCYLSGAIAGRSGNRGECAQPCRTNWNLVDAEGHVLLKEKALLSIHDLDLGEHLEALADAGVMSFKIEGRLKDADYVKNVVSHLRRKLDAVLEKRPEYARASLGRALHAFSPDPEKTFTRGHNDYRIDGERRSMGTLDAAGHLGEPVGVVRSVQGDRVVLDRPADLHPGDGLAFLHKGEVAGTLVNGVEGRQVFVQEPSRIRPGVELHRNLDHQWLKAMRSAKVERRIPVDAILTLTETTAHLRLTDEAGLTAEATVEGTFGEPKDPESAEKTIREAMERLGDTPFQLQNLTLDTLRFVPVSRLNALRREAAGALEAARRAPRPAEVRPARAPKAPTLVALPAFELDFNWNVSNQKAKAFYEKAGAKVLEPAAELQEDLTGKVVMTTRHCLRYELGWCHIHPNPEPWQAPPQPKGPVFLENGDTRLQCRFDCARCRMELVLA